MRYKGEAAASPFLFFKGCISERQSRCFPSTEPVFRAGRAGVPAQRRLLPETETASSPYYRGYIRHNSSAQNPKSINSLIRQDLTLKKCKLALDKTKGKYANY